MYHLIHYKTRVVQICTDCVRDKVLLYITLALACMGNANDMIKIRLHSAAREDILIIS